MHECTVYLDWRRDVARKRETVNTAYYTAFPGVGAEGVGLREQVPVGLVACLRGSQHLSAGSQHLSVCDRFCFGI